MTELFRIMTEGVRSTDIEVRSTLREVRGFRRLTRFSDIGGWS